MFTLKTFTLDPQAVVAEVKEAQTQTQTQLAALLAERLSSEKAPPPALAPHLREFWTKSFGRLRPNASLPTFAKAVEAWLQEQG